MNTSSSALSGNILVTSALPYVNGIKHLGNLAGSLLPADVHARFQRARGRPVLFVCGTDDHGTPAELAAADADLDPETFCARQHSRQAEVFKAFGLSFDHFGRTSSPTNHDLTRRHLLALHQAGLLEERETPQPWCTGEGRFLPDRYVTGGCPRCGYARARGDQCDGCGSLLDPSDLKDPRSVRSGERVVFRPSRHLYLRLSLLEDRIRAWLAEREADWERLPLSIARAWLDAGLQDRAVTRDLSWGIPVPLPGFEGKVAYVWFDAPIGYLALVEEWAAAAPGRAANDWLGEGEGRRWVQFLGKDNVPFHTVSFPATQLGAGLGYRTVDVVRALSWLTWREEGGGEAKFSTSEGRGILLDEALRLAPADAWRWWLSANAPETGDTAFSIADFRRGCDEDLAGNLGNLASRVLALLARHSPASGIQVEHGPGGHGAAVLPDGGVTSGEDILFAQGCARIVSGIAGDFEALRVRKACSGLRELWSAGNAWLAATAPWARVKDDPARAAAILRVAVGFLGVAARAAAPVVLGLADELLRRLGEAGTAWPEDVEKAILGACPGRILPGAEGPLFARSPRE